jgi:CheY-like chemotaxis protein
MQKTAIVVDDSRVARMTLKKLLITANFEVVEFGSGEEVLNYLESIPTNPDVIFMDVMMNGMDGLTATKKLKQNPKLSSIPVVMCTGNDTAEDRQKALEAGAITALTKPPVAEALADIVTQINAIPTITPTESKAEPKIEFDEQALIEKVRAAIEQDVLNQLQGNTETVSRQIAEGTVERMLAEQIKPQLVKLEQDLSNQLMQKADSILDASAEQVAEVASDETVLNTVVHSVQHVVEEANLPAQISEFLAQEGEEWLANQEEELGSQLSAQLERLIPTLVTEHLDTSLGSLVKPMVAEFADISESNNKPSLDSSEVDFIVNNALHHYTSTVFQPLISATISKRVAEYDVLENDKFKQLQQQVSTLKGITMGLGITVVGLLVAIIL